MPEETKFEWKPSFDPAEYERLPQVFTTGLTPKPVKDCKVCDKRCLMMAHAAEGFCSTRCEEANRERLKSESALSIK